jgi:endonuclease I
MLFILVLSFMSQTIRPFIQTVDPVCLYTRELLHAFDIEHVIPRSFIRDKCIEKDINILFKCNPSVNRSRQNKPFTDVLRKHHFQVVHPETKGIIARTCLYYLYTYYPIKTQFYTNVISKSLLEQWHDENSVSEYEIIRNYNIYTKFKVFNKFIRSF